MELKEILQGLLKVIAGASQIAVDRGVDRGVDSGVIDFTESINKAHSEILAWIKEKLPSKVDTWGGTHADVQIRIGRNMYREDALKNLGIKE